MLFQPAIIALLLASSVNTAVLFAITPFAIQVTRHWDISSGSERQLKLERRTYLVSTLLAIVLAAQLIALLLFVFNADRMAPMFAGAMCAVGSLNASPYGFPALIAQLAVFFLASMWLAINHADSQAPDYPLVRVKYLLLLALAPVVAGAFYLEVRYFLGLKADVLTSCCSRQFSGSAKGFSGDLAALPPATAMIVFYGSLMLAVAAALYTAARRRGGYVTALSSLTAFVTAIAGIVSFLSLYVYEHPHHHCPFCLLKAEYGYQGYLLYVPLLAATACGLGAGALQPFGGVDSLRGIIPLLAGRLAGVAAAGFAIFAAVATILILRSNLILIEPERASLALPGMALFFLTTIQGVTP